MRLFSQVLLLTVLSFVLFLLPKTAYAAGKTYEWTNSTDTMTAVEKAGLTDIIAVSAGQTHTLALKKDGTVWAWGYNNWGQIGNGTSGNIITEPVKVSNLSDVKAIATGGEFYSLALKNDGTVWAWGYNGSGTRGTGIGIGTNVNVLLLTPTQVKSETGNGVLSDVIAIAAGSYHSLALKSDGSLLSWGYNNSGQLGNGCSLYNCSIRVYPQKILTGIVSIAAGRMHSLAVKTDGTVWGWGRLSEGELGSFTNGTSERLSPMQISGVSNIKSVAAKEYYSLALSQSNTVFEWGGGRYLPNFSDPRQVPNLDNVVEIAAGQFGNIGAVGLGIREDGTVWQWERKTLNPKQVLNLSNIGSADIGNYTKNIAVTKIDSAPEPFLDLPWEYEAKGLTFNEAALSMFSYFDHEYPLLSGGLVEDSIALNSIINYESSERKNLSYSKHDGYDYARGAQINIGDPVLAAAAGWATFKSEANSGGGGNVIKIDHENGYQTWYEHLAIDGLVINVEGQRVHVEQGDIIGRVGMTGKTTGAHIHFGVFQDKNNDGNFDDNIPDGVTDPFGWQSTEEDPWEHYSFMYGGQQKTGNKSYYLWKKKISGLNSSLTSNGGVFKNERYDFNFPANATNQNLSLEFISRPIVKVSKILTSIGTTIQATAKDTLGNIVTQFNNPLILTIDFANFDLSNINLDTLSIYSSNDGMNWNKEITDVDLLNSKASSQIIHFTYFALMGEKKDIVAPITIANANGLKGEGNWFRSDVLISLTADDGIGIGIDYTVYRKDGSDWETYSTPITFSQEGNHKIEFYSVDKDENIEEIKTFEFDIDKTLPLINSETTQDGSPYLSNAWTNKDVLVSFYCEYNESGVLSVTEPILISTEGKNQKMTGECTDKAGNKTTKEVVGINIDKTNPEAEIKYNINTQDLEITSKDISPVEITKSKLSKNIEQILITDSVGYSMKITGEKKRKAEKKEIEIDFEIKKIEYNNTPSLNLAKNKLSIQEKTEHAKKELKQSFSVKEELKIRMEYESKKKETRVITKVKGEEKLKEKLSGIRILKLYTERGNLKYGY